MLCCFVDDLAHWKPKKKENVTEYDAPQNKHQDIEKFIKQIS